MTENPSPIILCVSGTDHIHRVIADNPDREHYSHLRRLIAGEMQMSDDSANGSSWVSATETAASSHPLATLVQGHQAGARAATGHRTAARDLYSRPAVLLALAALLTLLAVGIAHLLGDAAVPADSQMGLTVSAHVGRLLVTLGWVAVGAYLLGRRHGVRAAAAQQASPTEHS